MFENWFAEQVKQKCYANVSEQEVARLKERVAGSRTGHHFLRAARIIQGDIRKITSDDLLESARLRPGDLTLVTGGPPCQPFSRAGKREPVDGRDGQLFREFVRVVDDVRPRWFLFENVKGLILTKTEVVKIKCNNCGDDEIVSFDERTAHFEGRLRARNCRACGSCRTELRVERKPGGSLDIILREFEAIGYICTHAVLNAADFGVPQTRERLIIVGSRDGERFVWPHRTHAPVKGDAVVRQQHLFATDCELAPWVTMWDALWQKGHPEFGALDPKRTVLWVKNVVRPHDEPVTWSLDRVSPTIGAHQSAKLAIAPNGVPEEQLRRQQWHVLGRRQGDFPPVEVEHSYLTDQELLKLQTFPDHWYLYGTRMQRAFQIGNAVPVDLAKILGVALATACGQVFDRPERLDRGTADEIAATA